MALAYEIPFNGLSETWTHRNRIIYIKEEKRKLVLLDNEEVLMDLLSVDFCAHAPTTNDTFLRVALSKPSPGAYVQTITRSRHLRDRRRGRGSQLE
jgi:hypothetical protein